jgi:hypothetical protein
MEFRELAGQILCMELISRNRKKRKKKKKSSNRVFQLLMFDVTVAASLRLADLI